MRVVFASAELAPLVKVGGLGDAASGLSKSLIDLGVDLDVVIPDYWGGAHRSGRPVRLETPDWAGPMEAIRADVPELGRVHLISAPALVRPHPYDDELGRGWPDNDFRFFSFAAGVTALVERIAPDVLHLNDWHTGAALGLAGSAPPSVFTIHNPAYQGTTSGSWLDVMVRRPEAYEWYGGTNPLTGAIALADAITTVSPTFAEELLHEETGFGLSGPLHARGERFSGIANGIDVSVWDPSSDGHLGATFDDRTVSRKRQIGRELRSEVGLEAGTGPMVGMVTRLTDQKGVDLALGAIEAVDGDDVSYVLLGSGDVTLADRARSLVEERAGRVAFVDGFDEGLAHRIFGGSDLVLIPSRFEPCGLTQMQAMRYGSMPVVTDVGGLHDTVVDADADPDLGTGFIADSVTVESVAGALRRGLAAWRSTRRRGAIRRRGMTRDWSWRVPAKLYMDLYETIRSAR